MRGMQSRRQHHTQRGETQKQKLVDAAYDIIAEQGFEGLRTREVALRAHLNISTLHYYFESKEDLVRSVAQRLLSEFKSTADQQGLKRNAVEKLHKAFSDQVQLIRTRPATYIVVMELFTKSLHDPKLGPVAKELLDTWEKHFRSFITEGLESGLMASDSEPLVTTRMLQCLMLGRALTFLIRGEDLSRDPMFHQVSRWLSPDRNRSIT